MEKIINSEAAILPPLGFNVIDTAYLVDSIGALTILPAAVLLVQADLWGAGDLHKLASTKYYTTNPILSSTCCVEMLGSCVLFSV